MLIMPSSTITEVPALNLHIAQSKTKYITGFKNNSTGSNPHKSLNIQVTICGGKKLKTKKKLLA